MTDTSSSRQISLEDYINLGDFKLVEGGAVGHISAADEKVDEIYRNLSSAHNPLMTAVFLRNTAGNTIGESRQSSSTLRWAGS